jgi:hypothetical protein
MLARPAVRLVLREEGYTARLGVSEPRPGQRN